MRHLSKLYCSLWNICFISISVQQYLDLEKYLQQNEYLKSLPVMDNKIKLPLNIVRTQKRFKVWLRLVANECINFRSKLQERLYNKHFLYERRSDMTWNDTLSKKEKKSLSWNYSKKYQWWITLSKKFLKTSVWVVYLNSRVPQIEIEK